MQHAASATPRPSALHWTTEAPLRMLMNNLDDEVAERPGALVVYSGIGRAARDWASYERIIETLRRLREDQTLLVQSRKPVGVFETHGDAGTETAIDCAREDGLDLPMLGR